MKKSLVVVALAGAMAFTAASAETVLYGSIRLGAEVAKNHFNQAGDQNKRGLDMQDFGSRLGLKGSEDLGNGTKVLYQLEWAFNGMEGGSTGGGFNNRLAWIGLNGEWGTVALGRQNNPFTESLFIGTESDNFNGNLAGHSALRIATGTVMTAAGGDTEGDFFSMPTRVGNSIAYVSPSFSGFNFVVAGIADAPNPSEVTIGDTTYNSSYYSNNNSSKGFDIYTVGLNYEHESGFYAKAAYLGANLNKAYKTANVYGLNVGFANEQFGVNADFAAGQRGKKNNDGLVGVAFADAGTKVTSTGWDLGGHFSFGPDYFSTIRATVGQAEVKYKDVDTRKDKITTWAVGFEQKLSTRTKVWVEYAKNNQKFDGFKENKDAVSIGLRHDF